MIIGINFWIEKSKYISPIPIKDKIDITQPWKGGIPILKIKTKTNKSPQNKKYEKKKIINNKEAALCEIKYFNLLIEEFTLFREIKIGIKHNIFNSNKTHWTNILSLIIEPHTQKIKIIK